MRVPIAYLVVLGACGGSSERLFDAGIDADAVATCSELQDRYRETVLAIDDGCTTAADCVLVGGVSSCDCEPVLGPSCWGHPVNGTAYEVVRPELSPIVTAFREQCRDLDASEIEGVCDCEPWAIATCEMGHCNFRVDEWCLGPPPFDAGP